ncbi:MAG TPA: Rieske 2Fe-2S domain-containing protein [Candidatus Baltobacteraceae bacterium]|jgi:toluene monooxygenase system ferredoxin subunit
MGWDRVSGAENLAPGKMQQLATEGGNDVLILNGAGTFYACQAICPHMDTPLEEGMFDGETLTCHQHLWQWDIATGDPKGLSESPLECLRVKNEDGAVMVWRDD